MNHRGENNGQRDIHTQDDLHNWYMEKYPTVPPLSPMRPEINQKRLVFPSTLPLPAENHLLPTFPNIQINPYHPLPKTTLANTAYDPTFDADFSRLSLSSTPSRSCYGLGFDCSVLRNQSGSQLDYTDLNLHNMRVESAVRGQTGLYMEPHGFSDLGEEGLDGLGLIGLNPSSLSHNIHNTNGVGYVIDGLSNRWSRVNQQNGFYKVGYGASRNPNRNELSSVHGSGYRTLSNLRNRNGCQSAYDTGYGAPANSNRYGSRVDNGIRRGRSGNVSGADSSGGARSCPSQGNDTLSECLNKLRSNSGGGI